MSVVACSSCGSKTPAKADRCLHCREPIRTMVVCVECQNNVHVNARVCPRCNSADFAGLPCEFCGQTTRKAERVSWSDIYEQWRHAHLECLRSATGLPIKCQGCGVTFALDELRVQLARLRGTRYDEGCSTFESGVACNRCGHQNPLALQQLSCKRCRLPIFAAPHVCRAKNLGCLSGLLFMSSR